MKNLSTLAIAGGLLLLCLGCEVFAPLVGPDAGRADTYEERVNYHRGPCYGRCPVYTLKLYDNGLLIYEGERFTDKPGTWQRTIDRRSSLALIDSFERADFENYPRTFRKQIADAASVDLVYTDEDGERYSTSYADYSPPELLALDRAMRRLAALDGYRLVSDTIPRLFSATEGMPPTRQEIIVQLRAGVAVNNWIIKYDRQNATVKQRLSPNGDYYLIELSTSAGAVDEILDRIRRDEDVMSAQLNNPVDPRR